MDAGLMLIVSVLTPWLLERLKWARWFPLMKPYASWLNRVTPLVVAAAIAAGITFTVDDTGWTLKGPLPEDMLRGFLLWAVGAVTQHVTYERAKKSIEASV